MYRIIGFLLISLLWIGCDSESGTARIEVRLTDAPGDYQEVNIDIQGVEVHVGEAEGSGWTSLQVEKGVYDLIKLTNGADTLLALGELPAGTISQIRLLLGDGNTLMVGDQIHDLKTPSGQQSGLKLNLHSTLTEGVTYKVLLDFDVARSIVERGNGEYNLKPVIKSVAEATSGAIKGTIDPAISLPAVFAIVADDTVATTYADEAGGFLLRGVPAGTYKVTFEPKEGFEPSIKENVSVTTGSVTDVGVVIISEN